jgi:hypothetical protein
LQGTLFWIEECSRSSELSESAKQILEYWIKETELISLLEELKDFLLQIRKELYASFSVSGLIALMEYEGRVHSAVQELREGR